MKLSWSSERTGMKCGVRLVLLFCGLFLLAGNTCRAGDELLNKLGRQRPDRLVNDYAGVLSRAQASSLEGLLLDLERQTGAQIAVVILPSLEGGQIDDFANHLYERWGIGGKGKDNGALLLVALKDRKVRIEIGYGLEGILPDAKAGRIRDQAILPAFRQNRYAEGVMGGAYALAQVIAEDAGVKLTGGRRAESGGRRGSPLLSLLLLILFIPLMIRHPFLAILLLSGGRGRGFSGGGFGGGFGGFGGGLSGGGGASGSW